MLLDKNNKLSFPDQDVLNILFFKKYFSGAKVQCYLWN
ncbi:hypothetical protein [Citrobacter freundii]